MLTPVGTTVIAQFQTLGRTKSNVAYVPKPEIQIAIAGAFCYCSCRLIGLSLHGFSMLRRNIPVSFFYKTIGGVTFVTFVGFQHEKMAENRQSLFLLHVRNKRAIPGCVLAPNLASFTRVPYKSDTLPLTNRKIPFKRWPFSSHRSS